MKKKIINYYGHSIVAFRQLTIVMRSKFIVNTFSLYNKIFTAFK